MIVKVINEEFECDKAIKGSDFIKLYKDGKCVAQFIGISNFNIYEVIDGEFDTATTEIEILKQELADTDYVVIKIAEGSATTEEYADIIARRQECRARINELQGGGE